MVPAPMAFGSILAARSSRVRAAWASCSELKLWRASASQSRARACQASGSARPGALAAAASAASTSSRAAAASERGSLIS